MHHRLATLLGVVLHLTIASGCDRTRERDHPRVLAFTVSATRVRAGDSVAVRWQIAHATRITITAEPGGPIVEATAEAVGEAESAPLAGPTRLVISAATDAETVQHELVIEVDGQAPTIERFTVEPNPGPLGGTVMARWQALRGRRARILRGSEVVYDSTSQVATGTAALELPEVTNRFSLEVSNPSGLDRASVEVTAEPGPRIDEFRVVPTQLATGSGTVSVSWATADARLLTLTSNGRPVTGFPGTPSGQLALALAGPSQLELTASSGGGTVRQRLTVGAGQSEVEPNDTAATANTLAPGRTSGRLDPTDDLDWFAIDVPAGGHVQVDTEDADGGCVTDTALILLDSAGALLGRASDGGPTIPNGGGTCARIDPRADAFARDLPAGRYLIGVSAEGGATGPYFVEATIGTPRCGNRILERSQGEECDDGTPEPADGCDGACLYTGPQEQEPNERPNDASPLGAYARGRLDPADDVDLWAVAVPEGGSVAAWLTAPDEVRCAAGVGLELSLIDRDGTTERAVLGGSGPSEECGRIDPVREPGARGLAGGIYYLRARAQPNTSTTTYFIRSRARGPGCGNGLVEAGEECDDGDLDGGDGCSASCALETAETIRAPGGTVVLPLERSPSYRAVRLEIARAGQSVTAVTSDGAMGCTVDTRLGLRTSTAAVIGTSRDGATFPCAAIRPTTQAWARDLAVGNYLLVVENEGTTVASSTLDVQITDPRCGNGLLERRDNEVCDDGNTMNGDGCSSSCRLEATVTPEQEPNDTLADANALTTVVPGNGHAQGDLVPAGDADTFSFVVPNGQRATVIARTQGAIGDPMSCPGDTRLVLLDSTGRALATDEDGGHEFCSSIDGRMLPGARELGPGTYYLRVEAFNRFTRVMGYVLRFELR
jgi:cysteine-rich repeat protein